MRIFSQSTINLLSRIISPKLPSEYNFKRLIVIRSITTINRFDHERRIRSSSKMEKNCKNSFCFNDYDCVGFDLDNTIVKYNVKNMIYHEYEVLSKFLTKRGYSKEYLFKPLDDEADFLQKGLILDFERGNLLRVCPDGSIQIASHGTKFMSKEEIVEIYGEKKRWEVTDEYCKDMLVAW
jgi:hypothetical protein